MKGFYAKFRIMLITFALGLASVFMMNGSLQFSDEVYVDLPKVKSETVILVNPKYRNEMPKMDGIIACDRRRKLSKEQSEEQLKKIRLLIQNRNENIGRKFTP